jgi:cytochrome P450
MSADNSNSILDYPLPAPAPLDPPKEWAQLREGCPFAQVRLPSGDKATLITRYADVRQVLSDPRFSNSLTAEGAARVSTNDSGGPFKSKESALLADSEWHQRWRRLIMRWFTAKRITAMQQRIEAMADQLVDEMLRQGAPVDLVSTLGFPLPVWVICDLLGVPDVDRAKLAHWSNTMLSMTQYTPEEINQAQAEFNQYLAAHIAAKRQRPGDDLLSVLSAASDEGQGFSEHEMLFTAKGLLVAGHETTSNMIGKMVAMLLADRRRWEQLLADPALVRSAVEEVLRYDANSGFGMPRYISEDLELAGTTVPRGTTVICSMGAANRDEQAFPRASEMELGRSPNPHLAFGAGPHSCVGQSLARTELQTVLSVLLRRLPTLELAVPTEELPRRKGLLVGGLEQVLVRW